MHRYGPDPQEARRIALRAGCRIKRSERLHDGTWSHFIVCKTHRAKVQFLAALAAYDAMLPDVRRTAERAARGASSPREQVEALHAYVRDGVTFTLEPGEIFSPTMRTLEMAAGDCDDQARALAALLGSLGHPTAMLTLGDPPRHVGVGVKPPAELAGLGLTDGWAWLETTIDADPYEHPLAAAERLGIKTRGDISG